MISNGKRVLVVDDDERERQETALVLKQAGFTVVQACNGLDALSEMRTGQFDALVTDCHMPQLNGLDLLAQSRVIWSTPRSSSSRRHGIREIWRRHEEPLPGSVSHLIPMFF